MLKRSPFPAGSPMPRRLAVGAVALAVLLAVAAAFALLTRDDGPRPAAAGAPKPAVEHSFPPATAPAAPAVPAVPAAGTGSVPAPPQISDPVAYAKAAAAMLWSYDTRDTGRDQQLTGMRAWMTTESAYADWNSVTAQVPDPVLWSRMADNRQYATATAAEGHYPNAFKQALADDPSAITKAYVYVVTVNGKQQIHWRNGGGGAEERAVTLAVQCRSGHDCSLAAIAPTVTQ
ncbi:hypothetical protein ACFUCQ_02960 [Streptomyces sp. NPDC057197]|uniref:hypothetical protein n=1 Tax=Streptomyces sp. NPDC057197 TaxID=3346045 RepID=UPI00363994D0